MRALTRQEVISVIEGKSCAERIPVLLNLWVHADSFGERANSVIEIMNRYPQDIVVFGINMPHVFDAPEDDPDYRWVNRDNPYIGKKLGPDQQIAIYDWSELDDILEHFPNPQYRNIIPYSPPDDGRYRLIDWWYCLFERHWQLRGMTNALMDYYTDPESVHRLFRALTDFYMAVIERAKKEHNIDGILTSDDLGTQVGPFFSPQIFREFYKPYYKELIDKAHSLGVHFWLHACGNIEPFLPDFIEIGLDVIHPIQKYTMDQKKIAKKYGSNICIWAGFDVQRVIPWGTPEEVRQEVRNMVDTYFRKEGRFMFTAGNAIKGDCPIESLEALYEEIYKYGAEIVVRSKAPTSMP